MLKVKKYLGTETYMFANGDLATPEAMLKKFPAILTFTHFVKTDENEEVAIAVQNLSVMREYYNIDPSLSEDEAITAIETIINTPQPTPEAVASPEERIAAALEYQNMMSL